MSVENPHKSRSIPQCLNCQLYGHTKNVCTKTPVCVKCAGKHSTSDCQHHHTDSIKCALCGEQHTANYKGCPIYKALRAKKFPSKLRSGKSKEDAKKVEVEKSGNNDNNENFPESHHKKGVTYAQAVLSTNNGLRDNEHHNQASDMQDLKAMMKQLMAQLTNMLQLITLLLSRTNEQYK